MAMYIWEKYVYSVLSIKYLKASMPNTSLQIYLGIEAFNDNRKVEIETVHYKCPFI